MKKILSTILLLTALLTAFTACSSNGDKKLTIAGKSYTEAQLTAEIMAQLLEEEGFKVERKYDMAGAICFEAIRKGDVDLYPEYTGGMVMAYLGQDIAPGTDAQTTFQIAKEGYEREFDLIVLPDMGFNNTYANAINADFAEANGIVTNSDLAAFSSQLIYGGEHAFFDRMDGYFNMCETYGYDFSKYVMMDVGLKQKSIQQGEIDVTNIYTTDGFLEGSGLRVLEDNLNFFPAYYCAPVVRKDVLEKHPEIETALAVLDNCATEENMVYYNSLVDNNKMSIPEVATLFIQELLK